MGEVDKHRHLVIQFTVGNGLELGSSGEATAPHAIQLDLPEKEYHRYNVERPPYPIHWRGTATDLPFKDKTLDWISAVHLLEDWPLSEWGGVLREWARVLKVGAFMIISVPDRERFRARIRAGQSDNLSHRHESRVGELSEWFSSWEIIMDRMVNEEATEYSIIFVAKKLPNSTI